MCCPCSSVGQGAKAWKAVLEHALVKMMEASGPRSRLNMGTHAQAQ